MHKELGITCLVVATGVCGCVSVEPTSGTHGGGSQTMSTTRSASLDPASETRRGILAAQRGDYNEAKTAFTRVLGLQPANAKVYDLRGRASVMLGDYEAAIPDLNRALEIEPEYGEAYAARAMAWYYLDEFGKMKADLAKAGALGASLDAKFEAMMRNGIVVSNTGWIEMQFGRVVSPSSGEQGAWEQQIVLHSDDGKDYTVEPSVRCRYEVPQSDRKGSSITFQVGKDNQYVIRGLASEYRTYAADGQSILFSGTKIRASWIKRTK